MSDKFLKQVQNSFDPFTKLGLFRQRVLLYYHLYKRQRRFFGEIVNNKIILSEIGVITQNVGWKYQIISVC